MFTEIDDYQILIKFVEGVKVLRIYTLKRNLMNILLVDKFIYFHYLLKLFNLFINFNLNKQ